MASSLEYRSQILTNRLKKREKQLRKWAQRRKLSAYRVYDRDIPEIPIVVDRYDSLDGKGRFVHVNDYRWDDSADEAFVSMICASITSALAVPRDNLYYKSRRRTTGTDQYQRQAAATFEIEVGEGGLRFIVNLSDYIDTGLFLDHRLTRAMIAERAKGTRMLNVFSYTGAFSVYAAAGGARETVSVDLNARYNDWCRRNLAVNGLDSKAHTTVVADAVSYLAEAAGDRSTRGSFDLIVLDPPTFSNSKKTSTILDTQRDHPSMIKDAAALLAAGGLLYFSTNAKRFKLEEKHLEGLEVREITPQTIDHDFVGKRPHRAWVITRK